VWSAVVFGFYAFAASKRGVYLLAMYPAVALLLGWWGDEQCGATAIEQRWQARLLSVLVWPLTGILGLTTVLAALEGVGVPIVATVGRRLPPWLQPFTPWVSQTIAGGRWPLLAYLLIATGAMYGCIRAARAPRWGMTLATLFCAVSALILSVDHV